MLKIQPYQYVGSEEIRKRVNKQFAGKTILTTNDILSWIADTNQLIIHGELIVTFIINLDNQLVIADRHSEHVLCANGKNVLSAGELTLSFEKDSISISEISNQSTGYCPEPASWQFVQIALNQVGTTHPKYFTNAFEFRYCENCQNTNLIKEAVYVCVICEAALDLKWNIDKMYNE